MKFVTITALLFSLLTPSISLGATLGAGSVVCDNVTDIDTLGSDDFQGKTGAEIIDIANKKYKFNEAMEKVADIEINEAEQEEKIASTYDTTSQGGARMQKFLAEKQDTHNKKKQMDAFLKSCALSGATQSADILEEKPISGRTKIRTPVNGKEAEVWTLSRFVSQ